MKILSFLLFLILSNPITTFSQETIDLNGRAFPLEEARQTQPMSLSTYAIEAMVYLLVERNTLYIYSEVTEYDMEEDEEEINYVEMQIFTYTPHNNITALYSKTSLYPEIVENEYEGEWQIVEEEGCSNVLIGEMSWYDGCLEYLVESEFVDVIATSLSDKIPTISDKITDKDDPEYGLWIHNMMSFVPSELNASSELAPSGNNKYTVDNLTDDNPQTAWVEGVEGDGIGEYIEISGINAELRIYNGYQKSKAAYYNNGRVKKFRIYFDEDEVGTIELLDQPGLQAIDLSIFRFNSFDPEIIKFEILEVYPGKKWKDTVISEIFCQGG